MKTGMEMHLCHSTYKIRHCWSVPIRQILIEDWYIIGTEEHAILEVENEGTAYEVNENGRLYKKRKQDVIVIDSNWNE